jgi:hypothetical protein
LRADDQTDAACELVEIARVIHRVLAAVFA